MPISAVTPYVVGCVFSEDANVEFRFIMDGTEQIIEDALTPRQRWRLERVDYDKVLYGQEWMPVMQVNHTTISRWRNDQGTPPVGLLNYLRTLYREISDDPSDAVEALMDYVKRREVDMGLDPDPPPPTGFDSWSEFNEEKARVRVGSLSTKSSDRAQFSRALRRWKSTNGQSRVIVPVDEGHVQYLRRFIYRRVGKENAYVTKGTADGEKIGRAHV